MRVYQFELHLGTAALGVVREEVIGIRGAADRTRAMIAAKNFAMDLANDVPEMRKVPPPRNVTNYVSARYVTEFDSDDLEEQGFDQESREFEMAATAPLEER